MLCKEYDQLNSIEKTLFIGQLQHACQSDSELFEMANKIITLAMLKGLFKTVTILPSDNPLNDNE